jgi:hypothetical protein
MTYLLASVPLKLREIAPIEFVPMAALLILLVEREITRARPGQQKTVTQHVMNLAVFPLMALFLLLVGLRTYTFIG